MTVSKCQRNEVQTLTLPYHHLNKANKNLTFWMDNTTFRWMLENCRLTSLNYPIQSKIIVVVGRCIPYLITIFWRNQNVDNIFSWSQQHYTHIDPLEHAVLPKHGPHVIVVRLFHPTEWYSSIFERWTFIPNVFHPPCVSGVDSLVEFIEFIIDTS